MNHRTRLLTCALVPVLALAALACEPLPPKQPAVPDRVALAGDSIAWEAGYYGGHWQAAGYDTELKLGIGWQMVHAQNRLDADSRSAARSPGTVVFAFGANELGESYPDMRWDQDDANSWFAAAFTPHPTTTAGEPTCAVWVLPWNLLAPPAELEKARQTARALADAQRRHGYRAVTVDWRPVVEEAAARGAPVLREDGVHLQLAGNVGPDAFARLVFDGAAACG